MRIRGSVVVLIALVLIGAGTYYAYDSFSKKPPAWLVTLVTSTNPPPPLSSGTVAPITPPEGFTATIFARDLPGARVMVRDAKGTMLVSLTKEGKIVALPDGDANGEADKTVTILENLREPHGITVLCQGTGNEGTFEDSCVLYVAETHALKSYRYDADTMSVSLIETLASFPSGDGHYTRTLLPHPDGKRLLISIGSSCNVCEEENLLRATVQVFDLAVGTLREFSRGLRNTVFMATDPVTGMVWGTDHGRDLIGDDIPPDEVNLLVEGSNYGWPLCYGKNVHDTNFDKKQYVRDPCAEMTASHIDLQAHSAALGLAFIPEEGWPEEMRNDLLIAYHGSWNRSVPTGYKVVRFELDPRTRKATSGPLDFLTGFLAEGAKTDDAIGRPVGVLAEPGGVVYISDDRAGAIYRISRTDI